MNFVKFDIAQMHIRWSNINSVEGNIHFNDRALKRGRMILTEEFVEYNMIMIIK